MSTVMAALVLTVAAPAHAVAPEHAMPEPGGDATDQAGPAIPRGRLSDAVVPSAYRLDLTLDPAQPRFSGHVEIDATLAAPTRFVDLNARGLTMRAAVVRVGGRTIAANFAQIGPTGVARLTFAAPLPAGPLTLVFDYDAAFGSDASGLHRVKVADRWYGWSQFESIDARAAFPSFDQPGYKTPFSVTVRTPAGLRVISNAPETSARDEAGLTVHRFAPTLPLPTYLVAMMVGPFAVVEGAVPATPQRASPLPLRIVSTQPNAGRLGFALAQSAPIVALLEDYFGQPFPFPKLDQITSPIEGGAMENAGADLYDDSILVLDDASSTGDKRHFGMVVAHELSHQWFGDLVTPAWWDDIWLNESFANWMGYRIGNAWRPDLNIADGALAEGFAAMDTDALLAGRPIHQAIASNDRIDAAFDTITYGKGGQVVAMIAAYMGDAAFRDGVRAHLAAHRYGNATSQDFFTALAAAAGDARIVPAMRSFTDQAGVPLLTFTRAGRAAGGATRYHVAQSRYVAFGRQAPRQSWGIPVCLRRGDQRSCRLLADAAADWTVAGRGALIANAGGTGYYRFELPRQDWRALIARAGSLDGGEAIAVSDSLAASVRAGRGDVGELALLARKLVNHPSSYASTAPFDALAALVDAGLVDDRGRAGWRRFLGRTFAPLLARSGFDPRAGAYLGEDPQRSARRQQIVGWIEKSDQAALVRPRLLAAATAYLGGDHAPLDPAYLGDGLQAVVQTGGIDAAKRVVEAALVSEDPDFRPAALHAAGASGLPETAKWLLDLDDARLRPRERITVLGDIIAARTTRDLGWEWLRRHADSMVSYANGIFLATTLPAMLRNFCSDGYADAFARTLKPVMAGTPGALALDRAIENVSDCARLEQARGSVIASGFARLR